MADRPVYIVGHKNPDLDSVAAAISYCNLKRTIDEKGDYIAACAGALNRQTSFVLKTLEIEPPLLLTDVRARVGDLLDDEPAAAVGPETNLAALGRLLKATRAKTVPVLDEQQRFLGLLTLGDVADLYMDAVMEHPLAESPAVLRELLLKPAREIMKSQGLVIFEPDELLEDARAHMTSTRYRNYPVVDDDGRFVGFVGRRNLLSMKRKQVILVDHNEKSQAVEGIEEADILEIIDHHRVGDIETSFPVLFRNEPVGSTCTLIAELYLGQGIPLSPALSGLLLSGLISDTMLLKSPTTTDRDRRVSVLLAETFRRDAIEWGKEMIRNSVDFDHRSARDIVRTDLKEYAAGSLSIAVAQIETVDLEVVKGRKAEFVHAMEEITALRSYDLMLLMVTDIYNEGTELLVAGEKKYLAEKAFRQEIQESSMFLSGVMSRKKQVIPVLYRIANEEGYTK